MESARCTTSTREILLKHQQHSGPSRFRLLLILLFAIPVVGSAQNINFRLQRDIMLQVEKAVVYDTTSRVHLGVKPISQSEVNPDLMGLYGTDTTVHYSHLSEIVFSRHLFHLETKDFEVMIDPLFNFEIGEEFSDTLRGEREQVLRKNTRGLRVQGNITDKVSFMASFYENQAVFPRYIRQFVSRRGVVPGHGRVKSYGPIGHDFAMSTGYVAIAPTDFLTIQYGHDKNFIGHGYRSLLLSDNSFNYPHLRVTWQAWKNRIQYTSVFGKIQSLRRMPAGETREPNFAPKGFSYHYLSIIPWDFLEIGFYEAFVWRMYDPETNTRTPFIGSTVNPLIFANTVGYGLDDSNNGLLGMNIRIQPIPAVQLYGQAMLDDMESDKFGFQIGAKWFNALIPNLDLQVEYNRASAYSYGREEPMWSYTHNNEYLAHPWGAGFDEAVGFVNYRWKRLMAELKVIVGQYQQDYQPDPAVDALTHFGKEILRPENAHIEDAALNPARHSSQDFRLSYVINPRYNFMINAGVTNRLVESPEFNSNTTYVYIGLRTFIDNQYFDF